jgi:hypothetical protein
MDGFAIPAAGEIGLRNSAPMAADFEDRNHVIGIVIGLEIEQERRMTQDAERSGSENCTLQAMRGLLAQDQAWGPCG